MVLNLTPNESVLWEGKATTPIRGVLMTVLFFFGIGLAQFGIGGEILAFFSFLLFIATLIFTVKSLNSFRNVHYYVTNLRLVSKSGDLQLQRWTTVRVAQDFLNKIRGIGTIYFDSDYTGRIVFQRVKEPETVKQTALSARSRLPPLPQQIIRPSQPPPPQTRSSQQPITREIIKETIKETVLVQCRHCGARATQGTLRCPGCGANL